MKLTRTNCSELNIDLHCLNWQQTFLSIIEQCIPKKVLPSRRRDLPWLSKSLIQSMRRRNCLFQRSNNPAHKTQYKHVRNQITFGARIQDNYVTRSACTKGVWARTPFSHSNNEEASDGFYWLREGWSERLALWWKWSARGHAAGALPGAAISVYAAFCAIMLFVVENKLSYTAIENLLKPLQLLCPPSSQLPSSLYTLKKFFSQLHTCIC